jgi:hypothetical protein
MTTKNKIIKSKQLNDNSHAKSYIGNYSWLEKLTELYGPVSLYVVNFSFMYGKKKIEMNLLLMGDLHTKSRKIRTTQKKQELHNFVQNILRTNSRCFDLFIETFSPHISENIGLNKIRPFAHKKRNSRSKRNSKRNSRSKHRNNRTSPNKMDVGTAAPLLKGDRRKYDIPLEAMRESPLLLQCRYHNIYNKRQQFYYKCKFPNLRYHSWDLRFTRTETDLSILAEISMTYDIQLYHFATKNGVSGKQLTQFLMGRPMTKQADQKVKRMYYYFYGIVLNTLRSGNAETNIREVFSNINVNADYKFENFNKQRILIQKQFNKVPVHLRKKLVSTFTRVYNTPDTFCLALTDFYTICRMLSKFRYVENKSNTCHNSEYVFCQNIIYYAGAQHTSLILDVFLRMFGKKSLMYSTGIDKFHEDKSISIKSFRTSSTEKGRGFTNLKQPKTYLDVLDVFYRN